MFACLSPGGQSITQGEVAKDKLLVGTVDGIFAFQKRGGSWESQGTIWISGFALKIQKRTSGLAHRTSRTRLPLVGNKVPVCAVFGPCQAFLRQC